MESWKHCKKMNRRLKISLRKEMKAENTIKNDSKIENLFKKRKEKKRKLKTLSKTQQKDVETYLGKISSFSFVKISPDRRRQSNMLVRNEEHC